MKYKNTDALPVAEGNSIAESIIGDIEKIVEETANYCDKFELDFLVELRKNIAKEKEKYRK